MRLLKNYESVVDMTEDQNKDRAPDTCDTESCKDDLMRGLFAFLDQIDEQTAKNDADTEQ